VHTTRAEPLVWRSSSACPSGASCIEVAALPNGGAALRDGKDPQGPVLCFSAAEWAAFRHGVGAGEFDPAPTAEHGR
jgi:hypothetical protein